MCYAAVGVWPASSPGQWESSVSKEGECRGKGETVEHLGDARPRFVSLPLVSPVPRGQGILETVRDGLRLDGQLRVKVMGGVLSRESVQFTIMSINGRSVTQCTCMSPDARQPTEMSWN